MSEALLLPGFLVGLLSLLLGAALGGIFARRGTFTYTYNLLTQKLQTYEALQRMDEHQIKQLTAERDAAAAERDTERARSTRLERLLADCQIARAEVEAQLRKALGNP